MGDEQFAHHAKCDGELFDFMCLGCEQARQMELMDEIERLREALRRVRTAIFKADCNILTDTLWMHDRAGETVVDCIDHALNDYDWESVTGPR